MKHFVTLILFFLTGMNLHAQETGHLKFEFNTDSAHLVINNNSFDVKKVESGDSVTLPIGTHLINLSTPLDLRLETYVTVQKNRTKVLQHIFKTGEISRNSLHKNYSAKEYFNIDILIISDSESSIFMGDSLIGIGHAAIKTNSEPIQFKIKNSRFGSKKFVANGNRSNYLNTYEFYRKPQKKKSFSLSPMPGFSQLYKRQYFKGAVISLSSIYFIKSFFDKRNEIQTKEEIFYSTVDQYRLTRNELTVNLLGDEIDRQREYLQELHDSRNLYLGAFGAIYLFNLLDAFLSKPKGGYQEEKPLRFYIDTNDSEMYFRPSIKLSINLK